MKPPSNAWREVWDCMAKDCLKEITYIDTETLDATLDTYLRKHKYVYQTLLFSIFFIIFD